MKRYYNAPIILNPMLTDAYKLFALAYYFPVGGRVGIAYTFMMGANK